VDLVLSISGLLVGLLCGWLATRAWRVCRAVLRWLGAGVLALGTVVLALPEAFACQRSVALRTDGACLVAGTSMGEVRMWRLADRTPRLSIQSYSSMVWSIALSTDQRMIASGDFDGLIRL
jgi:WD40 repeat protein